MGDMSCCSKYSFDVLIVGGGHAGIEAACAAARIGAKTALLTGNLDTIGMMSCNPAIGGVGKGQIVREVDALGGVMGRLIDQTGIQFRMLNRSKGPAMQGPRAQADKALYRNEAKYFCEQQPNLSLRQEQVVGLITQTENGKRVVRGITTQTGSEYYAPAVVLCSGTFLQGVLHYGPTQIPGGRCAEAPSVGLSQSLIENGIELKRFKTGTPARINARSVDYSKLIEHAGDPVPEPFSFMTTSIDVEQIPCWMAHTNPTVHKIITDNLDKAPMYTGQITSTGPRYCPSIETKVVRFADKDAHQIFLEPEGRRTNEMYVNGLSTSLPPYLQDAMIHAIVGLEEAEIIRYAYAIEYDYAPSLGQIRLTLETTAVDGLYLAGQLNGTTGYEEAAAQGLVAGANAALKVAGREPLKLTREQAYIGVMIDDLVTRGADEPYRMFTSRAECRLRLRGDNADRRLTPVARSCGLIDDDRWQAFEEKTACLESTMQFLQSTRYEGMSVWEHLRRPGTTWESLTEKYEQLRPVPYRVVEQILNDAKYSGYLKQEDEFNARQGRIGRRRIPADIDYFAIKHLRMEAKEALSKIRPETIEQASRIGAITPADIAVLTIYLGGNR